MEKRKIIAIDDQPENLQLLIQILKDDFSVIASTSGQKGIELAKKHDQVSLVLLDMFMPEIDGFEVLKQLKSDPETAHLPVFFVTGNDDEVYFHKGIEYGAYDFIVKPISPALLRNRINKCLESLT